MTIGEVVEELIWLRDRNKHELSMQQDQAICNACNVLDKLPAREKAEGFDPNEKEKILLPDDYEGQI